MQCHVHTVCTYQQHNCLTRFQILQPPVQSVPGASSFGMKGQRNEAEHSPPSSRG